MADVISGLPCNADGLCMVCKQEPLPEDVLSCTTCASPWHLSCLSVRPETSADVLVWQCPDCTNPTAEVGVGGAGSSGNDLVAAIRALEGDGSLSEAEKAKRRQELMCKNVLPPADGDGKSRGKRTNGGDNAALDILKQSLNCSICQELPERPVTTPCGHNFCLKCYEKWVAQGKTKCANCRQSIPSTLLINFNLMGSIRIAKASQHTGYGEHLRHEFVHRIRNQDRPDKAFRTERAVKAGNANASSGRIFVTTPSDHFGPITAEYDPERNKGVAVGETWGSRIECRQWGIHRPFVAGIAGQSGHGAQSVVLAGGYDDDEDHGDWFIYTGSGGKELTDGNRRTNTIHSFDQTFTNFNQALRLSCHKGYPVRVVRSSKEKNSPYAPAEKDTLRYDGIYRIEKCWRKTGTTHGFKVCRYLFVRCDNEPAPWTSDDHGDLPRPLPIVAELDNAAVDITETKGSPSWDYDAEKECWMWKKPPPLSKHPVDSEEQEGLKKVRRGRRQGQNMKEKVLKGFKCGKCKKVMTEPVTTPCGHNFCKACLQGAFAGMSLIKQRTCQGRRTLRSQKNVMKCPNCPQDIAEFIQNPQVNKSLENAIELLQKKEEEFTEKVEDAEKDGQVEETKETNYNASEAEPKGEYEHKNSSRKRKRSSSNGANLLDGEPLSKRIKLQEQCFT